MAHTQIIDPKNMVDQHLDASDFVDPHEIWGRLRDGLKIFRWHMSANSELERMPIGELQNGMFAHVDNCTYSGDVPLNFHVFYYYTRQDIIAFSARNDHAAKWRPFWRPVQYAASVVSLVAVAYAIFKHPIWHDISQKHVSLGGVLGFIWALSFLLAPALFLMAAQGREYLPYNLPDAIRRPQHRTSISTATQQPHGAIGEEGTI